MKNITLFAGAAIYLNHVGFTTNGAKHVVITDPPSMEFEVSSDVWYKTVVFKGKLQRVSGDLGEAWVGDFSALQQEGLYDIYCGNLRSRPFPVHDRVYDQALRTLYNYYPTQRCGDSLSGWCAPCHLGDAQRADTGERLPLAGGWHQSCDLRKWITGSTFGLLGLSQLGIQCKPRWDNGQIAAELRWGNRYFHNMIRPDGGLMDAVVAPLGWGDRNVAYNDAPTCASYLMIVGQAMAANFLRQSDPQYAEACVDHALRLWRYMTDPLRPQTPYTPLSMPDGHEWLAEAFVTHYRGSAMERGDALYAALKLAEATGRQDFMDEACAIASQLLQLQSHVTDENDPASGCFRIGPDNDKLIAFGSFSTFGTIFGAMGLTELAQLKPEHADAPRWRRAVYLIAEQKCRGAERNPWGLIPSYWSSDEAFSPRQSGSARYRYFFNLRTSNGGAIRVGPNSDIAGSALFLLRAADLLNQPRYRAIAQRQLDWILGCNPFNSSTVEGVGQNQPLRYMNGGEFFPPTPQIPGGVMTGIVGDDNDNPEPFSNNCSTEYDIPANAPLMWLLSELL